MKLISSFFAVAVAGVASLQAEDEPMVDLPFKSPADVREIIDFYATLAPRRVYADLLIHGHVPWSTVEPMPKAKAVEFIRTTLLEKAGIEMRDGADGEILIGWSDDPGRREARALATGEKVSIPAPSALGDTIQLQFSPWSDVREILFLYHRLTARKLFLQTGVRAHFPLIVDRPILPAEAVKLIRDTLLEKASIAVRDDSEGNMLVGWSNDPRYSKAREMATAPTPPPSWATPDPSGRPRIRIVK